MIRSSKHTIKFANHDKKSEYQKCCVVLKSAIQEYINLMILNKLPIQKYLTSPNLPNVCGIDLSRWKQLLYAQASQILQLEKEKTKKRVYKQYQRVYARCIEKDVHKKFTSKRFSELKINYNKRIKINLKNFCITLDSKFFDIQKYTTKEFDEVVRIVTPFRKAGKKRAQTIKIPIKHHKQSNKFKKWTRRNTIRISGKDITLIYERPTKEKRVITNKSISLGIDLGYKKAISVSNGKFYGRELENIYNKIVRRKRKSKGYQRALIQRTNETNRIVNRFLYENDFDTLFVEDLKNIKKGSKFSTKLNNRLQYWIYRQVIDKLERTSEEEGFYLLNVDPAYTSQTCSVCGTLDKQARKGEVYLCSSCNTVLDADYNASKNILHRGEEILKSHYSPSNKIIDIIDTNSITSKL